MTSEISQTVRPTVLITGATDGIGLALARRCQANGARLILVGRRPLSELDPTVFDVENYCQVDLSTIDAAERVAVWLECANIRRLDQVYLNAAVSYVGEIGDQSAPDIEAMVHVNLWTPIALVHRLAPLVASQHGQFVFVSSVSAAMPTPNYAVYTATKAALEGFVRSLRLELRTQKSPIRLTLVRPGATYTGLHAKSGADIVQMDWTRFPPAESTASALYRAARQRRHVANLGVANSLIHWTGHNASGLVIAALRRSLPPVSLDEATHSLVGEGAPQSTLAAPGPTSASEITLASMSSSTALLPVRTTQAGQTPHIVITGGAAGIGAALGRAFCGRDTMITLIDIDEQEANATAAQLREAGADVNVIRGDLSSDQSCANILAALHGLPPISVFINNAEISSVGPFLTQDLLDQKRVVSVNFVAPLLLTAGLLREQRMAPGASLVYISSLSHQLSYPGAAVYAATKDGIASLAKSLRAATRPADRHILTVYPGPPETNHATRYSPDNEHAHRRMPPEDVAAAIQRATARRQETLIPGMSNRLTATLARILPPLTESIMARTVFAPLAARAGAPDANPRTQI